MKPKLIVICGSNISTLGVLDDTHNSLFSSLNLSKYSDIIPLGDTKTGISLVDMARELEALKPLFRTVMNIIVAAHGFLEDGEYLIEMDKWVGSIELITSMEAATSGIRLNILFLSCYGANIHNDLTFLRGGSKIISLSDKDHPTQPNDYHHCKASEISDMLGHHPFKLENILEAYLFCQKFTFNTPIIGTHHYNGSVEVCTMQDLAKPFKPEKEIVISDFVQNLCKIIDIPDLNLATALTRMKQNEGHIESLQCKATLLPYILEHLKVGTFEAFKQVHEKEYYFANALEMLKQTTRQEFGEDTIPDAIDCFYDETGRYCSILCYDARNLRHNSYVYQPIDSSLEVNNIVPVYSVCMGLALDGYLQH